MLVEPLALVEPPDALSFFSVSVVAELEAELEGELGWLLGVDAEPETAPEAEPEGAVEVEPDGALLEPADEVAPEPGVVREAARSPASLSQPVSNPAPSARETATAKVESLICGPPWVGVQRLSEQGSGQCR